MRLPPCGGSGLKYKIVGKFRRVFQSPSVWREWIEIRDVLQKPTKATSPSVWREWIEIHDRRRGKRSGHVTLRVEGVD